MRTKPLQIVLIAVVFVAALAGALVLLQSRADSGSKTKSDTTKPASAAKNGIWAVGDTWTVKVRQDAGQITPDGDTSVATIPFRFKVVKADAKGVWTIHVAQDGAEGPFANGWNLQYKENGKRMELYRVSVGNEPPLEPQLASIALGTQFPYEVNYTAPPKDRTLDASKLIDRSMLPPDSLPGGDATPPSSAPAPKLEQGGTPPTGSDRETP